MGNAHIEVHDTVIQGNVAYRVWCYKDATALHAAIGHLYLGKPARTPLGAQVLMVWGISQHILY